MIVCVFFSLVAWFYWLLKACKQIFFVHGGTTVLFAESFAAINLSILGLLLLSVFHWDTLSVGLNHLLGHTEVLLLY